MPPDIGLAYPDCLPPCARRLPGFLRNQEETEMEDIITKNAANAAKALENENTLMDAGPECVMSVGLFPDSYPGGITPDTLFDGRTERIVKAQADKMIMTGLFARHERDDLENRLRAVLAREMAKFNPARDRYVFTATILAKRGLDEVKRRGRHPEDGYSNLSLNIEAGDGLELVDLISDEDCHGGGMRCKAAGGESLGQLTDTLLATLNNDDRDICAMIMEGMSLRGVARRLGIPVTTVHWRIANHVAPAARRLGLGGFAGEDEA